MEKLAFLPWSQRDLDRHVATDSVLAAAPSAGQAVLLGCRADGALTVSALPAGGLSAGGPEPGQRPLAVVFTHVAGTQTTWFLLARDAALAVNGLSPLPLMRLDPGAVLTFGRHGWWVATVFRPIPQAAPAELQHKLCPVCGGPLGLAPVVRCECGRWSHLERPQEPQSADALNCYLAAATCSCGRAATLDPQISPEPPPTLLPRADAECWA